MKKGNIYRETMRRYLSQLSQRRDLILSNSTYNFYLNEAEKILSERFSGGKFKIGGNYYVISNLEELIIRLDLMGY